MKPPMTEWREQLPWRIDVLAVSNFRCFDRLELQLDPQLTVLVGKNGAGKSAALRGLLYAVSSLALQLGLSGEHLGSSDVRRIPSDLLSESQVASYSERFPVTCAAEGAAGLEPLGWNVTQSAPNMGSSFTSTRPLGPLQNDDAAWPILGYYGTNRGSVAHRPIGMQDSTRAGAYAFWNDARCDMQHLREWFSGLYQDIETASFLGDEPSLAARRQIEAVRLACDLVLETSGWERLTYVGALREVVLRHPQHGALPVELLSDGIRFTAGLVFDLAVRAARANPHLGGRELLEQTPGIVLIDEIDQHLHPAWQQTILPSLVRTFPNVQFVVTTHSPHVLSSIDATTVRVFVDEGPNGIAVRTVEHTRGVRVDPLLVGVFGVDPFVDAPIRRDLERYLDLVERGEGTTSAATALRDQIDAGLGGVENEPQLAAADATIALDEIFGD